MKAYTRYPDVQEELANHAIKVQLAPVLREARNHFSRLGDHYLRFSSQISPIADWEVHATEGSIIFFLLKVGLHPNHMDRKEYRVATIQPSHLSVASIDDGTICPTHARVLSNGYSVTTYRAIEVAYPVHLPIPPRNFGKDLAIDIWKLWVKDMNIVLGLDKS